MKTARLVFFLCVAFLFGIVGGIAQVERADRQPAVAGQFYPAGKEELSHTLKTLFDKATPSKGIKGIIALICPHAGYVYSGEVAASSFKQIDPTKEYENIFVIGPSHYVGFEGASVYDAGDFITPLGTVKVNRDVAKGLIRNSKVFSNRTDAHRSEHSVEVELPFLQYIMKKPFTIVPIVVGASTPQTCAEIASALRPYFNTKNLFVISTDFSHYPAYADAKMVDKATSDAVLSNSVSALIRTVQYNESKGIANLVTSMCGLPCVLTLLSITQDMPDVTYTPIEYKNSGDTEVGNKTQVVGYWSIVISSKESKKNEGFRLDDNEKKTLLNIARKTLEHKLRVSNEPEIDPSTLTPILKTKCGAFVTLNENNELRGCIGRFDASKHLYEVIQDMAIAAAIEDPRFSPVRPEELKSIEIEISVLTPLRPIKSIDEIQMGKHGVYMRKGGQSGTFLPQVATETGWTKEEFLGHCAQDKAGFGWNGWKDADLYVYEALVFGEKDLGKK